MMRPCRRCGDDVPKAFCENCGEPYDEGPEGPEGPDDRDGEPQETDDRTGVVPQPSSCLVLTTGMSRQQWDRLSASTRPDFPEPPPPEQRFELRHRPGQDPVVLGRQGGGLSDVELQLPGTDADSGVSRRHCAFQRRRDGKWVVRDQGSTNGTRVNDGRRLRSGESWVLSDEDRIFLGAWSCLTVHIV
jgi:hypothetical protein